MCPSDTEEDLVAVVPSVRLWFFDGFLFMFTNQCSDRLCSTVAYSSFGTNFSISDSFDEHLRSIEFRELIVIYACGARCGNWWCGCVNSGLQVAADVLLSYFYPLEFRLSQKKSSEA